MTDLLGYSQEAAFAESPYVYAKATTGWDTEFHPAIPVMSVPCPFGKRVVVEERVVNT